MPEWDPYNDEKLVVFTCPGEWNHVFLKGFDVETGKSPMQMFAPWIWLVLSAKKWSKPEGLS